MLPEAALAALHRAHLGLTLGLLIVAVLRRPFRRLAGAQMAYGLWALPLWLVLAAWLPATRTLRLTLPTLQVTALAGSSTSMGMQGWASPLQGVWLVGMGLAAAAIVRQHRRYQRRLVRRTDGNWQAPAGNSPGLLGAWRPRLVLPADIRQRFTAQERRWILAHEHVHARRGDNPARLLATAVAVLTWFNPLVWWALGALRQDQELACDAAVMERFPLCWRAYGLALLKLDGATGLPPTASAWQSHHPLKERIMMLKNTAPSAFRRRLARIAVATTGLAALAVLQTAVSAAPSADKPLTTRITAREACPLMPRPEVAANDSLKGDYQLNAKFRIGSDGRPHTLQIDGERQRIAPLVGAVEQAVRSYHCKSALAGTEIEQEFSFKFD